MLEVFREAFSEIINYYVFQRRWQVSQFFAFLSLIAMFWSFQIKNKLRMMLLNGLGTSSLVISAALLGNWTLAVLFGQASIRNYVFCYFEWRTIKERPVQRK